MKFDLLQDFNFDGTSSYPVNQLFPDRDPTFLPLISSLADTERAGQTTIG